MVKFESDKNYDMYSQYQPVYGYYVDDDPKSATFGEVLFGQTGERNAYNDVLEFKDETDITYIKKQLLNTAKDSDWNVSLDEEMNKEINDDQVDSESPVKGGDDDIQDDSADASSVKQEEKEN